MHGYIRDGEAIRPSDSIEAFRKARIDGARCWVILGERSSEIDAFLSDDFGIHHLVVDDIWSTRQLPKAVEYDTYLQIIAHSLVPVAELRKPQKNAARHRSHGRNGDASEPGHALAELDILLAEHFIITHAHGDCGKLDANRVPRLLERGTAWVAHALIDGMVDDYVPLIDALDEQINTLEADVVAKAGTTAGPPLIAQIFAMKRSLYAFRRTSVHQREMLLRLSRGEFPEVAPAAAPYFRDVYDHFARVSDLADGHREHLTSILEGYWSVQSNRMNEIMKTLTLMSTVMLPLTFIAGLYGMNFEHMPELHWHYGYPAALAMMAGVAVGIVAWFRFRKWT
jgi:magnesium transporter